MCSNEAVWQKRECNNEIRKERHQPKFERNKNIVMQNILKEKLPKEQDVMSHTFTYKEGTEFMAFFNTTTEQGRHRKAHLLSVTSGLALAWAAIVPGASTTRQSNDHFDDVRHIIGLGVPVQVGVQPCLCGAGNTSRPDRAMLCNQVNGKATLRLYLVALP